MKDPVQIGQGTLHCGDCREVMKSLPDRSLDSIVTDPPYELGFMGKKWDASGIAYDQAVWRECLRVLKPGGHLLAFSGSRTYHRMACAIEDAGFEIRDQIMWLYGSGFPKSLDVSKAFDKAAGAEREIIGRRKDRAATPRRDIRGGNYVGATENIDLSAITTPSTHAAKEWEGWGTALKPAHEPIVVARKPLIGTVAENVLRHGTGAINVDGCRIPCEPIKTSRNVALGSSSGGIYGAADKPAQFESHPAGRWPANVIHDGSDEVLAAFPNAPGQSGTVTGTEPSSKTRNTFGLYNERPAAIPRDDTGSAARFFYCAKASKKDRQEGNTHPTVKPSDLMRYLCRLITPPGGTVLDPFMGSGSTGKAALVEGFQFIGIEQEPEYYAIACSRILPNQNLPQVILSPAKKEEAEPDLFSFSVA